MKKVIFFSVLVFMSQWTVADPFSGFGASIYYSKSTVDVEGYRRFPASRLDSGSLSGSADGYNVGTKLGYMWRNESPSWSYVLSYKSEAVGVKAKVEPDLIVNAGRYNAVEGQFGKVKGKGFLYLIAEYGKLDLSTREHSDIFGKTDFNLGMLGLGFGYAHHIGDNTSIHLEYVLRMAEAIEVRYISGSSLIARDGIDINLKSLGAGMTYRF